MDGGAMTAAAQDHAGAGREVPRPGAIFADPGGSTPMPDPGEAAGPVGAAAVSVAVRGAQRMGERRFSGLNDSRQGRRTGAPRG
jgi:hypothetical protein